MNDLPLRHRGRSQMMIKTLFASSILKETAERIQKDQNRVVDDWDLFESGSLKKYLTGHFSIDAQEAGAKLTMRYLKYARWLDMQDKRRRDKRDGYHLYNKIIYGTIYNWSLPTLQWGFTDEVKAEFADKLLEIQDSAFPHRKKINMQLELVSTEVDRNLAAVMAKSLRMGYR